MIASTLTTPRLALRAPESADFEHYAAFLLGPRGRFFGAPKTEAQAREVFDALTGHWSSKGYGPWVFTLKGDARALGTAGVSQPETLPEPELIWSIWRDEDEGKGYAAEAAIAARTAFYAETGAASVVSYIDPANSRSVALATRLGALPDPASPAPFDGGVTYRHPAPDADGSPEAYA
jgi:RimJ/RimL family protein N-acetyltransferase